MPRIFLAIFAILALYAFTIDYALEQLMQRAAPLIDQKIADKLKPVDGYVQP